MVASLDQGLASVVACRKDRPVASASVLDLALEVPMLARLLRADFAAAVAAKTDLLAQLLAVALVAANLPQLVVAVVAVVVVFAAAKRFALLV